MPNNHRFLFNLFLYIFFLFLINLPGQEIREGNLFSLITDIRENMPGSDSYSYIQPTPAEQDSMAMIIDLIVEENFQQADTIAQRIKYQLYEWIDTGNNDKNYYVLMEPGADQPDGLNWGWGTYIFYLAGNREVSIEVPHPYWDTNTWEVGFKAFQQIESQYFLMAGTHRYANGRNPAPADVAHNTKNVFHAIHQKIAVQSIHTLQVHGFNRNNPQYDGYPDVVLSNGTSNPSLILDSLASEIQTEGFITGIFDGTNFIYLGATTNTQGQWSNSFGYSFIHMELEYFIRTSQAEWENLLDAVYRTFYVPLLVKENEDIIQAEQIKLWQNYPNPFNPITMINYQLPMNNDVELIIYNLLGEKVATLVSEKQKAGHHQVEWDASGMASGIYYYQLVTESFVDTKKMLLIR